MGWDPKIPQFPAAYPMRLFKEFCSSREPINQYCHHAAFTMRSSLWSLGVLTRRRAASVGARRGLMVETESTPNPQSMKFLPGQAVLGEAFGNSGMYFELTKKGSYSGGSKDSSDILKSPLAKSLFQISGIKSVFFGKDFITITKEVDESWHTMKPLVFSKIFDFYASGKPIYEDSEGKNSMATDTTILDSDDEVVATIKELLETRIRPSVQEDGGDIFYVGFDPITGIVKVRLAGSCVGCPSSSITLRNGVEKMLKHYIPEVQGIEDTTGSGEGDEGDHEHTCNDPSHDHSGKKLSYKPQPIDPAVKA